MSSLPLPRLSVSTRLLSSVHAEQTSTYATVSNMDPHVHCIKNKINDAEAGYKILQETYKALPPVVKVLRESRTSVWKTQSELEVGNRVITDLEADTDEIMRAAKDCMPVFERTREAWEKMLACGEATGEDCAEAWETRAALMVEWSTLPSILLTVRSVFAQMRMISVVYAQRIEDFTYTMLENDGFLDPSRPKANDKERVPVLFGPLIHELYTLEHKLCNLLRWIELDSQVLNEHKKYAQGFDRWVVRTRLLSDTENHQDVKARLIPSLREQQMKRNGDMMPQHDPTESWVKHPYGNTHVWEFVIHTPAPFYSQVTKFIKEDPDCSEFRQENKTIFAFLKKAPERQDESSK